MAGPIHEGASTPFLAEVSPDISELLDDPRPGEVPCIDGLQLRKLLGKGVYPVYEAASAMDANPLALKIIPIKAKKLELIRVHREADALKTLTHANVVRLLWVKEKNAKAILLAMELLPGPTLEQFLLEKGRLAPLAVAKIGLQVSRGLEALHDKDFVHRDLKLRNLMFDGHGRIKIVDLGLVKSVKMASEDVATVLGDPIGSWETMPPEQFVGGFQFCSDLFSLGCVLYRLAVGDPPFPALFHNVSGRTRPKSPHDLHPEIPEAFSDLVMGLLEPFPEDRQPQTAHELSRKIEEILAGKLSSPSPRSSPASIAEDDPVRLIELAKASMNLQATLPDHNFLLIGLTRRVQLCCDFQDALEVLFQKVTTLEREIAREPQNPPGLVQAITLAFVEYTAGTRSVANQASLWPALNRLVQETSWQLQFFRHPREEVPQAHEVRSIIRQIQRLQRQIKELYRNALSALERPPNAS